MSDEELDQIAGGNTLPIIQPNEQGYYSQHIMPQYPPQYPPNQPNPGSWNQPPQGGYQQQPNWNVPPRVNNQQNQLSSNQPTYQK